jgi:hypothetical protein
VYHVEIRQFPHKVCRFNLSERELLPIVVPWSREEWVEVGERKWNVNQANLTIIEGPQLSLPELAMARGWRNAQRRGEDVTERVMKTLERAPAAPAQAGAHTTTARAGGAAPTADAGVPGSPADTQLLADSLGLEILALLDEQALSPQRVWRMAAERLGDRPAAESLALGERTIRLLLERRLIALEAGSTGVEGDPATALSAVESWVGDEQSAPLRIRRA